MRIEHFERLQPLCPTCRVSGRGVRLLGLGAVARSVGQDVREGVLLCPEPLCAREHPIIDGIPVLVADLASWASHQLSAVLRREDLTPFSESVMSDAAGPASDLFREQSNLSGYGHGHWDPDGGLAPLMGEALALLDEEPEGVWLDAACAAGRGTLELARATGDLAVGIDLSFAMLRIAERLRRTGVAVFPQRRVGMVFERRQIEVPDVPSELLSFWCCDAANLPFADASFAGALSLNALDCMAAPLAHLVELGRTLATAAVALLSTPYDWSATATPVEHWLGGHSQRGPFEGSSARELARILSPERTAGIDTGLVIEEERDRVPWRVYANERSSVHYDVHLLKLRRR